MVLKSTDDIEKLLSDEELHVLEEGLESEELSESKNVPSEGEPEPIGDAMDLYLLECRKTRLLSADEEKILGSAIEEGRFLSDVEQTLAAKSGYDPSLIDILVELIRRFSRSGLLYETTIKYLGLRSRDGLVKNVLKPELRQSIDGQIGPGVLNKVVRAGRATEGQATSKLVEFSLITRLIPWNVIQGLAETGSFSKLKRGFNSPRFRGKLKKLLPKIAFHLEHVKQRSQEAARQLTQSNLRLVVSVAKKYRGYGMPLGDLVQEGNIGLMRAVEKFDHRRGYKFSTYAHWWIRQAVGRAISDQVRTVRLPIHMADNMTRLIQSRQRLYQRLGRQPTNKELAIEMHLSPEKLEWLQKVNASRPVSLETPIGDEGGQLGDFIEDHVLPKPAEEATNGLLRDQLEKTLESLPARERRIIELRFGLEDGYCRTLEEVGMELGLTRERIRQLEKEALAKLRHPKLSRQFVDYLS
jgi:RNA polymerase sigma factor (sigma-70 family)